MQDPIHSPEEGAMNDWLEELKEAVAAEVESGGEQAKADAQAALQETRIIAQRAAVMMLQEGEPPARVKDWAEAELSARAFHRLVRIEERERLRVQRILRGVVFGALDALAALA